MLEKSSDTSFQEKARQKRLASSRERNSSEIALTHPYTVDWAIKILKVNIDALITAGVLKPKRDVLSLRPQEQRFCRADLVQAYIVIQRKKFENKQREGRDIFGYQYFSDVPMDVDGMPTNSEHLKYLETEEGREFLVRLDAPRLSI